MRLTGQEINRTHNKIKFSQGFGIGAVCHSLKTVFDYREDPTEREHLPGKNQNQHYENDTYRQSVRIRPVNPARRLGLGRSRKQALWTCLQGRKIHVQCTSGAQGHEADWPSGQRISLQPLRKAD
jgi:hypothetical protein